MLRAGDIVTAARDYSPSFDAKHHPDPVAVRFLSGYAAQLRAAVARVDPLALAVELTVAVPPAAAHPANGTDEPVSVDLPAYETVHGVAVRTADGCEAPVPLVDGGRGLQLSGPVAYRLAGALRLGGDPWSWEGATQLVVTLTPAAAPLVTLESAIALPETARTALVAGLALFLAGRAGVPLPAVAAGAEEAFIASLAQRRVGRVGFVREGW